MGQEFLRQSNLKTKSIDKTPVWLSLVEDKLLQKLEHERMNNEDISRADPLAMHHFCKDFQIEKDRRRIHLQSSWSNRKKGSKNEYPKI